jgi:Big-like domain-containing protein
MKTGGNNDMEQLAGTTRWWKRYGALVAFLGLISAVATCGGDDETITAPAGASVSITGEHSLQVGDSMTLVAATVNGADSAYRWSSSRTNFATVDDAGTVTAVAAGEAIVTAEGLTTGAKGEHVLVVTAVPVETVVVTVSGNPFVQVGDTVMLTATTVGGDDSGYTWSSSDELVVTVDGEGVVTGRYSGDAVITAVGNDTGESGSMAIVAMNEVPHYDEWLGSAHADKSAEAFNHWNEEQPAEVPTSCARCHSTPGYVDYLGADGSAPEVVDLPAPIGTVVECGACHNDKANALSAVSFPSGEVVDALGAEARCMVCHQGRASGDDVDEAITNAMVASDDETSDSLGFLNIHYYSAAATLNAGRVRGGYQYAGEVYDWRFRHVPGYDTCVGCHDPHTLEVKVDECATCHTNVAALADLKDIRMIASRHQDYDGDGDKDEGMYYELQGVKDLLLAAIQEYTVEQSLGAVCYDEVTYPYWFKDTDANGTCEAGEATNANKFAPFTARLMKATYNYQVATKDPGGFAHNSKYLIQLVYDAAADVNSVLVSPVDITNAVRNDVGHFNGASEAARHWDADEEVSSSCSKCHGGSEGYRFFLAHGVGTNVVEPDNGLDCVTCHDTFAPDYATVQVDSVLYPSGITISDPGEQSNLCAVCHSGRESKKTIDTAIAANQLSFRNVHYLPAAAVKRGTVAKVGYEYAGHTYAGEWSTHGQCVNCHDPVATNHTFSPLDNPACTAGCHAPTPILTLRTNHVLDYDGDANTSETLNDEIQGLAAAVLAQMSAITSPPICYSGAAYPYFFKDGNTNGICDPAEQTNGNKFSAWTPALMKAAHNYQISQKEHGAWAHNFDYMAQLLIDSVQDLGGSVAGFIRP